MTRATADATTRPTTADRWSPDSRAPHGFLPFLTPVRGHAFASPPPGDPAPVHHGAAARVAREPDNPADPLAVAVWAIGSGTPWRIGYLERAVAARVAPRLDGGAAVTATLAGWWDAPTGGWSRPVVALRADRASRVRPADAPSRIWGRPPASATRTVRHRTT